MLINNFSKKSLDKNKFIYFSFSYCCEKKFTSKNSLVLVEKVKKKKFKFRWYLWIKTIVFWSIVINFFVAVFTFFWLSSWWLIEAELVIENFEAWEFHVWFWMLLSLFSYFLAAIFWDHPANWEENGSSGNEWLRNSIFYDIFVSWKDRPRPTHYRRLENYF